MLKRERIPTKTREKKHSIYIFWVVIKISSMKIVRKENFKTIK